MPSVDDRIVALQFDNKRFEANLATTMASLEKLKTSMDFTKTKAGLNDLKTAGDQFNMTGVTSAIENINNKFSAMGAIAFSVLNNVVTRAIDAGISIAKSLSLNQVISGFREYEQNMNAIQTVLANTRADGTTLDQVNLALDQLNQYSDKTIYNFGEMAKNIGTFTAAGVNLETSVSAIKGIANLAAISGSNSQQASTAMYQLSQALSAGKVSLMDWNSIVNAGMGGAVFQEALFNTGKALKTIKNVPMGMTFEKWTAAGNTFRGSLEEGWLTGEVLTNTLQGFTGELTEAQLLSMGYTKAQAKEIQDLGKTGLEAATKVKTFTQLMSTVKESVGSGWSSTFRILIGTFDEAKALFTGMNNVIGGFVGRSADARNELLQGWKDAGGRLILLEGLKNIFDALVSVMKVVTSAFREIFPPMTVAKLLKMTVAFRDFTKNLSLGGETLSKIKLIFKGVFATLSIGITIVKQIVKSIGSLFGLFNGASSGGALGFFSKLAKFIISLEEKLVSGGGIQRFFETIGSAIKDPSAAIDKLVSAVNRLFASINLPSAEGFLNVLEAIAGSVARFVSKFSTSASDKVTGFFTSIFGFLTPNVSNSFEGGFKRFGNILSWFGTILKSIGSAAAWLWEKLGTLTAGVKSVASSIGGAFSNFGSDIAKSVEDIDFKKVLTALKLGLAVLLADGFRNIAKDGLKFDFTGGALSGLAGMFEGVKDILPEVKKSLEGVTGVLEGMQMKLKSEALMKIAISLGILAAAMAGLSMIDPEALAAALVAMSIGFAQIVTTLGVLNKVIAGPGDAAKLSLVAVAIVSISAAMLALAGAMKIFSLLSWEELAKGFAGAIGGLVGIAGAMQLMPNPISAMASAFAITAISVAMVALAGAMAVFSLMSWESIAKGLAGVVGGLGGMALALQLMPNPISMLLSATAILKISGAVVILAGAVFAFSLMSWEDIAKGIIGLGASLAVIGLALQLMPNPIVLMASSFSLVAIAGAVAILAASMSVFALLSWNSIAKGLVGMAGALAILALSAKAMESSTFGAIAVIIMAKAMVNLAKAVTAFSGLSWGELIKGLVGLSATMLVVAGGAVLLSAAVPAILAFGASLSLLGVGIALFGIGAQKLSIAFQAIVKAGKAGVDVAMYLVKQIPAIVSTLVVAIIDMVDSVLKAAPSIIKTLGDIIIAFLKMVEAVAPQVAKTFVSLVRMLLTTIENLLPDFVNTGLKTLTAIMDGITENLPKLVESGHAMVIAILKAIAENTEEVITAGMDILIAFLDGIANKITDATEAGLEVLINFIFGISENIEKVANAAIEVVTAFIRAIEAYYLRIIEAGVALITNIIKGVAKSLVDVVSAGAAAIIAFVKGISDNSQKVVDAGFDIIIDFINGIANSIRANSKDLRQAGINLALAIADGFTFGMVSKVQDMVDSVVNAGKSVIQGAKDVLNINSPSKVFIGIAESVAEGFVAGLDRDTTMGKSIRYFGKNAVGAFETALSGIPEILSGMGEFNPTITPVLDLSSVKAGARGLGAMLAIDPSLSYDQARTISLESTRATEPNTVGDDQRQVNGPTEIKFVQNINSPTALSTADIYRQTRNQIALAKGELAVL